MLALGERCNQRTRLRLKTQHVVTRVEHGSGRELDLRSWSRLATQCCQLIEPSDGQVDSIDTQYGFVSVDEVDDDLCLTQHAIAIGGGHALDCVRRESCFVAGDAAQKSHRDEHEAQRDTETDEQSTAVESASHGPILAASHEVVKRR